MTVSSPPHPAAPQAEPSRLDLWLVRERGLTRSAAQTLVRSGSVLVNGRAARVGQRIHAGDAVEVAAASPVATAVAMGPPVSLTVVYEDPLIAVIDKPAGLVVHPAPGHPAGTLADGLRQRGDTWSLAGGRERPGIVHRLDRLTSGLLVVAKTEAAHRSLSAQLAGRSLVRRYWALVRGTVAEETGSIDAPIGRDPRHRQRMAVVDAGRAAVTDFSVLERCPRATVLDVSLRSGRTHQIRVHCAWIGRPIVGDAVYGVAADRLAPRPALHARELRLRHPGDGGVRVFTSPLPGELVRLLELARRDAL